MNGTPGMCANTEQTVTLLEWCAGYGGIGLGLRRAIPNLRTIGYAEIEDYPITVLASLMEKGLIDIAPIWSNLKAWPCEEFRGKVDILVAGFPCQPFSHAGKRGGDEDPRHLWPYISRAIGIIRPRYVFCENVEGILSARLAGDQWSDPEGTPVLLHVLRELERLGYRATAGLFSAAECGAPHNRKRTFICGMDDTQVHRCRSGIFNPSNIGCADIPVAGTDIPWPTGPSEDQQLWEPARAILVPKRGIVAADGDDEGDDDGLADADSGGLEGTESLGGEGRGADAMCEGGEQPGPVGDTECVRQAGRGDAGEVGSPCGPTEGEGCEPSEAAEDSSLVVNAPSGSDGLNETERQGRDTISGSGAEGGELGNSQVVLGNGGKHYPRVGKRSRKVSKPGNTGGQEVVGNPGVLGQTGTGEQATGVEQRGEGASSGAGNLADLPSEGLEGELGQELEGRGAGSPHGCNGDSDPAIRNGEAIQPMGGDSYGPSSRMGGYRLPGLSDYQLAEICEWMSKTPHRAEELKMLGNGVVPAVSELAWRTLVKRLWDGKVGI